MTELLGLDDPRTLFVQGCVRNQGKFYETFDAIVLLSAPAHVILERIANRTTNDYGKAAGEERLILHHLETVEPLLRAGCTHELDASRPLDEVVADLISISERLADPPRACPEQDVDGLSRSRVCEHLRRQSETPAWGEGRIRAGDAPEFRPLGPSLCPRRQLPFVREAEGWSVATQPQLDARWPSSQRRWR